MTYPIGSAGIGSIVRSGSAASRRSTLHTMKSWAGGSRLKVASSRWMTDPRLRERFIKEGQAAARIEHKGIVRVYDADTDGTFYYIAWEFLDGRTLSSTSALFERARKEGAFLVQ